MQELVQTLISSDIFILVYKLVLVFVLSGFIGLERASLSKPAGFRTHVLVGISGVLTMVCGEYLYEKYGDSVDITRIAAQLLSGIGFLGAGTILRDGFNVKGLTTAASLLAVTCIGLCVGAGIYIGSIIATIIVYLVLVYSKYISDKVEHYNEFNLKIKASNIKETVKPVQELLDKSKIEIKNVSLIEDQKDPSKGVITVIGQYRDELNKNKIISKLVEIEGVSEVLKI